jgi:hypothetical protein
MRGKYGYIGEGFLGHCVVDDNLLSQLVPDKTIARFTADFSRKKPGHALLYIAGTDDGTEWISVKGVKVESITILNENENKDE